MEKHTITDTFHEKDLYIYIGDYDTFVQEMEDKWCDTLDWGNPLAMYIYVDWYGWVIWIGKRKLTRFIHELTHYTRDIGEKIWYTKEHEHEYYAYAMEYYTREAKKKIRFTS